MMQVTAIISSSPLWHDLELGPHAVGFEVHYLLDTTRPDVVENTEDDPPGKCPNGLVEGTAYTAETY